MAPGGVRRIAATPAAEQVGDDPGGRLVAQVVIGDQANAQRLAFQKLSVEAKSLAESGQVGDECFAQLQGFQVAQVVGLGTDQKSFSRSVSTFRAGVGWAFPRDADGSATGVAGRSRSR